MGSFCNHLAHQDHPGEAEDNPEPSGSESWWLGLVNLNLACLLSPHLPSPSWSHLVSLSPHIFSFLVRFPGLE